MYLVAACCGLDLISRSLKAALAVCRLYGQVDVAGRHDGSIPDVLTVRDLLFAALEFFGSDLVCAGISAFRALELYGDVVSRFGNRKRIDQLGIVFVLELFDCRGSDGNFDLVDDSGSILVYGVSTGWKGQTKKFDTLGVSEGDTITIVAYKTSYQGNAQVVGMYVSSKKGDPEDPDQPEST